MASPPHLSSLNMSRKRPSISGPAGPNAKKRKPSHLRNAFSPESDLPRSPLRYSRSPSVDSVATGSVANSVGGRKQRKRKDGDTQSVTGSMRGKRAGSTMTGAEGEGGEEQGADEDQEEEDEDLDLEDELLQGEKVTEASKKQEREHERLLMDAMNPSQEQRYATYRRIRLKRDIVRKLVNQTLSQSVPAPVIIAVTSYSKTFIGEIVDRACTVRDEWAVARTQLPNPNFPPQLLRTGLNNPRNHRPGTTPTPREIQDSGLYPSLVPGGGYMEEVDKDKGLKERLALADKGPLTPDHLREAYRRYKRDRDGGGAGVAGMSLEGVERTAARTGGKRLFR